MFSPNGKPFIVTLPGDIGNTFILQQAGMYFHTNTDRVPSEFFKLPDSENDTFSQQRKFISVPQQTIVESQERILYSSAFQNEAIIVASLLRSSKESRLYGVGCAVRVAYILQDDTLVLLDLITSDLPNEKSPSSQRPINTHVEVRAQFRSNDSWLPSTRSATTFSGHSLALGTISSSTPTLRTSLISLNQTVHDDRVLIVVHNVVLHSSEKTSRVGIIPYLLLGSHATWEDLRILCIECTLTKSKRGRLRLKIQLTKDKLRTITFPLHITLGDTCPLL